VRTRRKVYSTVICELGVDTIKTRHHHRTMLLGKLSALQGLKVKMMSKMIQMKRMTL